MCLFHIHTLCFTSLQDTRLEGWLRAHVNVHAFALVCALCLNEHFLAPQNECDKCIYNIYIYLNEVCMMLVVKSVSYFRSWSELRSCVKVKVADLGSHA